VGKGHNSPAVPVLQVKGEKMKIFKLRNGFIQHPGFLAGIAFILGLVAAYLLIKYTVAAPVFCKV